MLRVQVLQEQEDALLNLRERLANPPASFLPEDPVKVRHVFYDSFMLAWNDLICFPAGPAVLVLEKVHAGKGRAARRRAPPEAGRTAGAARSA